MSTHVFASFDPYLAWLSIREEQRPLDPYQLLGLPLLEANPGKINAAVMRQRQSLESFRAGANAKLWESLRDELEHAIGQLSDPDRKAILDAAILRKNAAARSPLSSGQQAPVGPSITCRGCQKENPSARRFCGHCGAQLWDACGKCNAEVPVDEKFCGICGVNLHETVHTELTQATATLAEAKQLMADLQYDAARLVLRKLAKSHDPRLDSLCNKAVALLGDIDLRISEHEQQAVDALERARLLLSGYAYAGAVAELQAIPIQFRNADIVETLGTAEARHKELVMLNNEIQVAIQQKRPDTLLPIIERLLKLKPNHDQAQQLAIRLRDRLIAASQKKLATHEYAAALDLLHQIPMFVRSPEIEQLIEQGQELHWLFDTLRHSPIADKTLTRLAERLHKLAPSNTEAPKLQEQICERRAQSLSCARHRYHAWAQPAAQTLLGWPIDWLTGFQNLAVPNAAHAQVFVEHPGQLFVALGLALQGLDKAPVDMNLMQAEKKTLSLKHLSSLLRRKSTKYAWGIDLSVSGLKAVKLALDEKDGRISVVDVVVVKHRKLLTHPEVELERAQLVAESTGTFLSQRSLQDARLVINMPAQKLMSRFFDLPPLELKKVADAVEYEARHQIPMSLASLRWDWSLIASRELAEHEESRRIVVIAGRDQHVQERLASLREVHLHPDVLTSNCAALHNFVLHEYFGGMTTGQKKQAAGDHSAIVTLDVGAEATNLVVTSPSAYWSRSINVTGDDFTKLLLQQAKVTHAQAELLKREPFRARRLSQMYAAFDPLLERLADEISRSLDSFLQLYPDQTLSRIYGVGGGFQLHGLWGKLRSPK